MSAQKVALVGGATSALTKYIEEPAMELARSTIEAAIVDNDDLETTNQPAGMRINLSHRPGYIACLIESGDHKRKSGLIY